MILSAASKLVVAIQGDVTLITSVLRSATAVKMKVNGQIEIFTVVNGQATISLTFSIKLVKVKGNVGAKT